MKTILNLTIKRRWLDMIVAGVKREEYRAPNCPQLRRCGIFVQSSCARNDCRAVYRAGYRMDSPAALVEVTGVAAPLVASHGVFAIEDPRFLTDPRHPEWGEPPTPHWTIFLGAGLCHGTYAEVEKRIEGNGK